MPVCCPRWRRDSEIGLYAELKAAGKLNTMTLTEAEFLDQKVCRTLSPKINFIKKKDLERICGYVHFKTFAMTGRNAPPLISSISSLAIHNSPAL